MPLLSPRAKVGSVVTASFSKVLPDVKPFTALEEKETWTSLVKPSLKSDGMMLGLCAREVDRRAVANDTSLRKCQAMVVAGKYDYTVQREW